MMTIAKPLSNWAAPAHVGYAARSGQPPAASSK
jgi:hypothetical protein